MCKGGVWVDATVCVNEGADGGLAVFAHTYVRAPESLATHTHAHPVHTPPTFLPSRVQA